MEQDMGASSGEDRATAVEPVPVSPLRDGIPSAGFTYKLRNTEDPEERLEDAAMWKALWDVSGGTIALTTEQDATFGAVGSRFHHISTLAYWDDPEFLWHCGREFKALPLSAAIEAVADLHARGKDAFVKSGMDKFFASPVRRGETLPDVLDALIFSFCDNPVPLMVQELVDFTFEHRFFVVDRKVVTWSPAAYTLTPLDFPLTGGLGWRKQADKRPEPFLRIHEMFDLAERIAQGMVHSSASIDIGLIGERLAVVEFNPLRCGQIGLFACDVRALAAAFYAQAIEARRAETQGGSVHESAVTK